MAEDAPKQEEKKKASLPSFGFAADLLKRKDGQETSIEDISASIPEIETQDGGDLSIDPHAPTRVFDFADLLDEDEEEEAPSAEIRIGTFVTFNLANERFALPVEPIEQVVRVSTITRVPHAPRPIRGVTNLRGRVIPVIDLRLRIGLSPIEIDRSTRVISVSSRGRLVGLMVDAVHHVMHINLNQVQPPPDDIMTLQSDYIQGVYGDADDLILLLDIDRALIIREGNA